MAPQPPQPTSGRPVRVTTNSFVIRQLPKCTFYHYDLIEKQEDDGKPSEPMKAGQRYREIVDKLFLQHASLFDPKPSYDGAKNMYSSHKIKQGEFTVSMSKNPNSNKGKFTIKITPVSIIQPSDFERLITPSGAQKTQANTVAVNLLQVIISQAPNLKHHFALHSKSFFVDQKNTTRDLPSGLQAWRGFFQSVRPALGKMLINIDITTAAVYKPSILLDNAAEHLGCQHDVRDFVKMCENAQHWQKLRSFYKGVTVLAYPNVKRKISDLIKNAGSYEFSKDGLSITVAEHFKQHHNMTLRFPSAFGVRIGKDAVYPAELCRIAPGQVYKKKLTPADTTAFLTSSVTKPHQRITDIANAVSGDHLDYKGSTWMRDAGMVVDPSPLQIAGRELDPPAIIYGGREVPMRPGPGAWNVMGQRLEIPARINAWAVVNLDADHSRNRALVEPFAKALYGNLQKLGIVIDKPKPEIHEGNSHNVEKSLTDAARAAVAGLPGDPKPGLVVVLLPRDAADIRKAVKQWGDMVHGIPTQCVRGEKWQKANDQYNNNVALKINVKCGGINNIIRAPAVEFIKDAMIVGCDVSHPSPGVVNRPSVASVVTSVDPYGARYHAHISLQNPRQEIIDDLPGMVKAGLMKFRDLRKGFPRHLVVYRDGVSEGEYLQIEEREINAVQEVLKDLERAMNHKTSLLFIVVGKRHHVRFFPADRSGGDRNMGRGRGNDNCNPGLVVDREIVHSTYPDFYLQSHAGIIGTSRPSHYIVLKNTANLTDDQIQQLSYALCHVYASATRAVSIPAPVYYADRVCARADFHFKPGMNFTDETASTSSEQAFDLDTWKRQFAKAKLSEAMYFL